MEQRPAIFKLNLDCFDHVFDYLALEDLGQFSQTCKAMKATVGEYYQANYGLIREEGGLGRENLRMCDYAMGYSDFIQNLCIYPLKHFNLGRYVKRDLSKQVLELMISPAGFTKLELHRLEYIINNVEVLTMSCFFSKMDNVFYETVPNMCNSLKRLHMGGFRCENAAQSQDENKWLLREYPTLEHLKWTQTLEQGYKINEIKAFFERNPNLRSFATNVECFWGSRQLIIESGVKFVDLTIEFSESAYRKNPQMIKDVHILLNELYEKSVYKRLHLEFNVHYNESGKQFIQQIIDQIIPKNAVRSMSLPRVNVNLSKLVNLVELQFTFSTSAVMRDVEVMAKYLVNLERVHFQHAHLKEMQSFIYHSVKLKKLRVVNFRDENVSALDLANMNKWREQLLFAGKVTIFIGERIYLATKWASTLTDYRLIEMRRNTAHEWGHPF